MKKLQTLLLASAAVVVAAAAASDANAALITRDFTGNDCAGFFNPEDTSGFSACTIFVNDDGQEILLSPVIVKYEEGSTTPDAINTLYPSVDGTEIATAPFSGTSGSWSYTPVGDDPGIRYWVAKAGNAFRLHWEVSDAAVAAGGACASPDYYNLACLNEALVVTSGAWSTPDGKDLSHLTWYDSEPPRLVPEPATLGLLGIGLLGAGYLARRRRLEA